MSYWYQHTDLMTAPNNVQIWILRLRGRYWEKRYLMSFNHLLITSFNSLILVELLLATFHSDVMESGQ